MGFISSRIWRNDDEEKMSDLLKPPQPKKIPKVHTAHGDVRVDDYYWLRDDTRKDPEVISYLEAENQYLEDWFTSKNDCRQKIYEEFNRYDHINNKYNNALRKPSTLRLNKQRNKLSSVRI